MEAGHVQKEVPYRHRATVNRPTSFWKGFYCQGEEASPDLLSQQNLPTALRPLDSWELGVCEVAA